MRRLSQFVQCFGQDAICVKEDVEEENLLSDIQDYSPKAKK